MDRLAQLIVDEVVRVHEDRLSGRRELLSSGVLVAADQLLLLGVTADQRLLRRQCLGGHLSEVLEPSVAVGMVGPLKGVAVGLRLYLLARVELHHQSSVLKGDPLRCCQ